MDGEMSDNDAREVPFDEQLRTIPKDLRAAFAIQWAADGTETGHRFIPIGYMAHKAADTILALRARVEELEREMGKKKPKEEWDRIDADNLQLKRDLAAANAENAAQREAIAEQCTRLNELMVGADDGTTTVIRRIGALKEQLALAHDAINDALPWMIKLGDYIGNGTQADPMGRCNAILKMRIAVEKRDD